MAISPPSDIVLDALRAADPQARAAKAAQLRKMAGETAAASAPGRAVALRGMPFDAASAHIARANMQVIHPTAGPVPRPFQQFEAAMLQNAMTSMLPNEDSESFGSGTAGSVNRGWMADAVAEQISQSGGIGVAKTLMSRYSPAATASFDAGSGAVTGASAIEPGAVSDNSVTIVENSTTVSGIAANAAGAGAMGLVKLVTALNDLLGGLFSGTGDERSADQRIRISR